MRRRATCWSGAVLPRPCRSTEYRPRSRPRSLSRPPPPSLHPPRVEESQPSIYYLPDKQGNLQPVLDFKYQDFVDLYKLKNQLGRRDQPPRYSLQRMSATGTAAETYAELTVQFQAVVRDDDWVRVPLRLDQGLLRGAAQYKGTGKQFVQYEGEGVGYVCWIRGKPDSQHEITLTMLVPLDSAGDETRLKLCVPRATASELKLSVPVAGAVGTVSEGATLLSSAAAKDGRPSSAWSAWAAISNWRGASRVLPPPNRPSCWRQSARCWRGWTAAGSRPRRRSRCGATARAFDRFTVRLPPEAEFSAGQARTVTP